MKFASVVFASFLLLTGVASAQEIRWGNQSFNNVNQGETTMNARFIFLPTLNGSVRSASYAVVAQGASPSSFTCMDVADTVMTPFANNTVTIALPAPQSAGSYDLHARLYSESDACEGALIAGFTSLRTNGGIIVHTPAPQPEPVGAGAINTPAPTPTVNPVPTPAPQVVTTPAPVVTPIVVQPVQQPVVITAQTEQEKIIALYNQLIELLKVYLALLIQAHAQR